jgi:hypothetical protein
MPVDNKKTGTGFHSRFPRAKMKRLEYPICPSCECEVKPNRLGLGRFLCPFCNCEYRHNIWHWIVGLSLLGGAGLGVWIVLGKALSAGFTLPWQAQLLGTVVGAFLFTWPIIGLIPRYKAVKPGSPPKVSSPFPDRSPRTPPSNRARRTQPLPVITPLRSWPLDRPDSANDV